MVKKPTKPKNPDLEMAVKLAEQIADDPDHGYSQEKRNSPDFDCSSMIATCLNWAGFDIPVTAYTGNLAAYLTKIGFRQTTKPPRRGDVFVTRFRHTVFSTSRTNIVHAVANERGTATGGKPGDQTGREIRRDKFYTPSYGWQDHLRFPTVDELATEVIAGEWGNGTKRRDRLTKAGYNYDEIQKRVNERLKK